MDVLTVLYGKHKHRQSRGRIECTCNMHAGAVLADSGNIEI